MLWNYGTREVSWKSLGQQGDQTNPESKSPERVFHFYNKPLSVKPEFMPLGVLDSLRERLVSRKTEWLEGRDGQPHPWFQGREESWSVVFVAIVQSLCLILCNPMDCSMPAKFPLEFAQTHTHWVGDSIQPSDPLSPPSSPALQTSSASGSFPMNQLFMLYGQIFRLQLQHQFFQWIFRVNLL